MVHGLYRLSQNMKESWNFQPVRKWLADAKTRFPLRLEALFRSPGTFGSEDSEELALDGGMVSWAFASGAYGWWVFVG